MADYYNWSSMDDADKSRDIYSNRSGAPRRASSSPNGRSYKKGGRKAKQKMSDQMKTRVTAICCLCAIAACCLFSFFYLRSIPKIAAGDTDITLEVVYSNGEVDRLPVNTSDDFLGDALLGAGLVETDDNTVDNYLTVNGVTVEDGAKWVFTKDGKELSLSVNKTPIIDGEVYTATYTKE